MLPILYRTPWFFIYSYTAVFAIAIVLGMVVTHRIAQNSDWLNGYLATFAAALAGGRIGFVIIEWRYYQERPLSLQNLWQGGFNYHAALLAGFVGVWVWSWLGEQRCPSKKWALCAQTVTLFAPAFALTNSFGWFACWLEGCGYGVETVFKEGIGVLFVADLPDNFGVFAIRYHTQWLGIIYSLLIFFFALRPKTKFLHVLLLISLGRFGIGLLRGDFVTQIGMLPLNMLLDIALASLCLILLQYASHGTKNRIRKQL